MRDVYDGPSILAINGLSEPFLRRALGAATGFLTGGPAGAIAGALASGGGGAPRMMASPATRSVPGNVSRAQPIDRCVPGDCSSLMGSFTARSGGTQVTVRPGAILPGGDPFIEIGGPQGQAASGRYGAGELPGQRSTTTSVCRRGMVLGNDGLCYPKRSLRNSDRMYPKGRKPLLTGGELNAITKASRAAKRVKVQQKRLQKLGMLPKPKTGRGRAPARPQVIVTQKVDD